MSLGQISIALWTEKGFINNWTWIFLALHRPSLVAAAQKRFASEMTDDFLREEESKQSWFDWLFPSVPEKVCLLTKNILPKKTYEFTIVIVLPFFLILKLKENLTLKLGSSKLK